jgi:hypothetical protein
MPEVLSHAELHERHRQAQERQRRSVEHVSGLLETQRRIGNDLGRGVAALQAHGAELQRIEGNARATGTFQALVRPFVARRTALARRSAAEGLVAQYEQVSGRLREALGFVDELKLAVHDLQDEVERLHVEQAEARASRGRIQGRINLAETELRGVDPREATAELRMERLRFAIRSDRVALRLAELAERLAAQHLGPARSLRDTAMDLHEQMSRYATSAGFAVDAAGARVQVLGMLADAPAVVADLHASVRELGAALDAAQIYVNTSQALIAAALPDLAAQLHRPLPEGWAPEPGRLAAEAEVEKLDPSSLDPSSGAEE